jgi:putative two-component system response regulator
MLTLELLDFNVLIIDDEAANVKLLDQILATEGYRNVRITTDSNEGLDCILSGWPDLILLDLHMPQPNGLEILNEARISHGSSSSCPILVFTADATTQTRREALRCGASDFLTKPGDMVEILLRVRNFLELRKLQKGLEATNRTLEDKVIARTQELWEANVEVVYRLGRAAEYRDDMTGGHINRVAELTYRIALEMGMLESQADLIRLATPLHDVGKIALPDAILLKKGSLTPEERDVMKRHTTVGAGILAHGKSDLLRMAEVIAQTHHERWDGKGYPYGLSGEDIPLVGRIVAVADVFDALTTDRPYKEAWPIERALDEIRRCAGAHFDPKVVDASMVVFEHVSKPEPGPKWRPV